MHAHTSTLKMKPAALPHACHTTVNAYLPTYAATANVAKMSVGVSSSYLACIIYMHFMKEE